METKEPVVNAVNEGEIPNNAEDQNKKEEGGIFEKVKNGVKKKKAQFGTFLGKHPELVVPLLISGLTITKGLFGMAARMGNNPENCVVKDDVTGLDYRTTHALTNSEIMELSEMKRSGISTGDALDEMKVLKNERRRK